jgi:hypothetical protein
MKVIKLSTDNTLRGPDTVDNLLTENEEVRHEIYVKSLKQYPISSCQGRL